MENKLEFKDLVGYLQHNLKVTFEGDEDHVHDLVGLNLNYQGAELISQYGDYGRSEINKVKPMLIPLSFLTKEIDHNGKKFIPFIELCETYKKDLNFNDHDPKKIVNQSIILMQQYGYGHCQTWVFEKLCEWHFDVFGLIDKGLAVPLT